MTKVHLLTRLYDTGDMLDPDPAGNETWWTSPFVYTAKEMLAVYKHLAYPNDSDRYLFANWTIEWKTSTGKFQKKFQTNRTLKSPLVWIGGVPEKVVATAWYSGPQGRHPPHRTCPRCCTEVRDDDAVVCPECGTSLTERRTYAYSKTYLLKEAKFEFINPLDTVVPLGAVYPCDGAHRIVETTYNDVTVTAKRNIPPNKVFVNWDVSQDPSTPPDKRAIVAGRKVTIKQGTWADLIANYLT